MPPLSTPFFSGLLRREDRFRRGLTALGAISAGYALCIFLLALGGAAPGSPPWLALPVEHYFWWESVFIGPVIFAGGLLAAAALHLVARGLGGHGSFEDTLALVGPAIAWSTLTTLVPDTVIALLLISGLVDPADWMDAITHATPVLAAVWAYLLAYLACFLTAFPAVARAAHGLRGGRALAAGWSAFVLYQIFLYVFVR